MMKTQSLKINRPIRSTFWWAATVAIGLFLGWGTIHAEPTERISEHAVEVTQDSVTISWTAGVVAWQSAENGVIPHIDAFEITNQPGTPRLPFHAVPFAIPADTELAIKIEPAKAIPLKKAGELVIAPQPAGVVRDADNNAVGGDYKAASLDPTYYVNPVVVEEIGTMGGVRLGRAVFNPVIFQDGDLTLIRQASAKIVFRSTRSVPAFDTPLQQGAMADILSQEIVNPAHLIPNRSAMPQRQYLQEPTSALALIQVADQGMVQLTYQHLLDFGIPPADLDPLTLQILHAGTALPIQWMGDADNQFEPGEAVRFFAPYSNSRWSATGRFLLKSGEAPRLDMAVRSGISNEPPSVLRQQTTIEQNKVYSPDCLCGKLAFGHDGDRWMWHQMSRPGNLSETFDASINLPDSGQPATLTVSMLGMTTLDHHVAVRLNNTDIGSLIWNGQQAISQPLAIPAGVLQENNHVELIMTESEAPVDSVWLDALHFDYATIEAVGTHSQMVQGAPQASSYSVQINPNETLSVYDVTVPTAPIHLSSPAHSGSSISWGDEGRTHTAYNLIPADQIQSPTAISPLAGLNMGLDSTADIIMIAPYELIHSGALTPLINLRQDQGWNVGGEAVEEIYAAFGDGEPRPEAIRDYLRWAYHNWDTRPQMILLVGDGSTDPKQHLDSSPITRIPPFLETVDPWVGETAVDNRFVTVDGDDNLPDMVIGRLPVTSATELQQVVSKIVSYETAETTGIWNRKTIWSADNAGSSKMFEGFSEELFDYFIQSPYFGHRFYLAPDENNLTKIQQTVTQVWQQGAGLVVYTGHASRHQWAAERLFHIDDVASLSNQEKLPFVMHLSCLTGSFHSSKYTALDEQLLRHADGGAIGVWGSTGLDVATGHHYLAAGALDVLYTHESPTLGDATLAGKVRLATRSAEHGIMLDTFNLLGDPATRFNRDLLSLGPYTVHLPIIQR